VVASHTPPAATWLKLAALPAALCSPVRTAAGIARHVVARAPLFPGAVSHRNQRGRCSFIYTWLSLVTVGVLGSVGHGPWACYKMGHERVGRLSTILAQYEAYIVDVLSVCHHCKPSVCVDVPSLYAITVSHHWKPSLEAITVGPLWMCHHCKPSVCVLTRLE
jgi:hypothetical protein